MNRESDVPEQTQSISKDRCWSASTRRELRARRRQPLRQRLSVTHTVSRVAKRDRDAADRRRYRAAAILATPSPVGWCKSTRWAKRGSCSARSHGELAQLYVKADIPGAGLGRARAFRVGQRALARRYRRRVRRAVSHKKGNARQDRGPASADQGHSPLPGKVRRRSTTSPI